MMEGEKEEIEKERQGSIHRHIDGAGEKKDIPENVRQNLGDGETVC